MFFGKHDQNSHNKFKNTPTKYNIFIEFSRKLSPRKPHVICDLWCTQFPPPAPRNSEKINWAINIKQIESRKLSRNNYISIKVKFSVKLCLLFTHFWQLKFICFIHLFQLVPFPRREKSMSSGISESQAKTFKL